MPKYLDQTGLATLKSKLDTTYAKKNDVYDKTAADGLLSVKANSADVYTKAQVDSAIAGAGGLPTITIALSQVVSQDPLQIQLTNEQYATLTNRSVLFDGSALGMPAVVANFNGQYTDDTGDNDVSYLIFVFSYNEGSETYISFNSIHVNTSTKVAKLSFDNVAVARADYAANADFAGEAFSVSYSTTAPTSENTIGLKIVVLSSEPATRYDGYLYIITGSN